MSAWLSESSATCGIRWDYSFHCSQLMTGLGWVGSFKKALLPCLTPPCFSVSCLGLVVTAWWSQGNWTTYVDIGF